MEPIAHRATISPLDLCFMSIEELSTRLRAKEISPVEVAESVLNRAETYNDALHVYITITRDSALRQARQAEKEILAGDYKGPLHGVTVSVKDNIATKGIRTSCASMVNPDWMPDYDATVVSNLQRAGAVLVGKANLMEYACSMNPAYPDPINPWHPEYTSSGSSSGSGVGVAAGMAHGSIGSDTGGSGRGPANVNGVVGFKATYGRVSRAGVVPLSYSLDHVSMMARSVVDAALLLQATAGHDPADENSARVPVPDFTAGVGRDIRGFRLAIARGYTHEGFDPDVDRVLHEAVTIFRSLGAEISEVQLPYIQQCFNTHAAITHSEAAEAHFDMLRTSPEKLGSAARALLDLGNVIPATAYIHAQRVRKLMRDAFRDLFDNIDALIGPCLPIRAGKAGTWTTIVDGRELDMRLPGMEYTGIYNLTGLPALVLPAGFSSEQTPIGIQIAGKWFHEATIIQIAHAYERAAGWHTLRPPFPDAFS